MGGTDWYFFFLLIVVIILLTAVVSLAAKIFSKKPLKQVIREAFDAVVGFLSGFF